jgi:hypothetical protein
MSHGEVTKTDWQNLVTVRPGPVLHVWRSGAEFCAVPLTYRAALNLIGGLTAAMQMALPNEGLPFDEHLARRDAERKPFANEVTP